MTTIQGIGLILLVLGVIDVLRNRDIYWLIWGLIIIGLPWLIDLLRMLGVRI